MRPIDPPVSPGSPAPARRPPVLALVAVSAISPFAINSVVPSMPAIEHAFDTDYGRVQLILSLFLAAVAVSQIIIGPLSDRFGRRPVLLVGFAIFVAACAASPFARSIEALIAMRVVQGASGCVGIVLGRAIVRDLFERRQAASMLGYVTMGLAVAPMLAPSIGGQLQEYFDWTAIFWFMAALGLGCLVVTWTLCSRNQPAPHAKAQLRHHVQRLRAAAAEQRVSAVHGEQQPRDRGLLRLSRRRAIHVGADAPSFARHLWTLVRASRRSAMRRATSFPGGSRSASASRKMILAGSALAFIAAILPGIFFALGLRQRHGAVPADDADRVLERPLAAKCNLGRDQRASGNRRRGVGAVGRDADRDGRGALGDRRRGASAPARHQRRCSC